MFGAESPPGPMPLAATSLPVPASPFPPPPSVFSPFQCVCGKNWVTFPVGISQFAFLWCLAVSHCPVFPKSCSQDQSLFSRLDLSASWPSWNFLRRGFGCHELEMMEEMSPQYWGATLREPMREAGCHTMVTYVLGASWPGLWSGAPSMVLVAWNQAVSLGPPGSVSGAPASPIQELPHHHHHPPNSL